MRAIILAGGKGVRLKPYTAVLPKPLVPIGDEMPILEIVIRQLKKYGFDHITITVNHLSHIIMAFFGNGERWDVSIDYSLEEIPLGTIGPLSLISDLPENFLLMNGDLFTDLNYLSLFNTHIANKNELTVAAYTRKQKIDFGVIESNKNNQVSKFTEKPEYTFQVSMGIYILNKSVLNYIPKGEQYGFDNLMIDGIAKGLNIQTYPYSGYWLDIGRPDDYEQANKDFITMRSEIL